MSHNPELEPLLDLQKRLAERRKVAQQLATSSANGSFPDDALRRMAAIQGASMALAEEIETHTPKIGHGGET